MKLKLKFPRIHVVSIQSSKRSFISSRNTSINILALFYKKITLETMVRLILKFVTLPTEISYIPIPFPFPCNKSFKNIRIFFTQPIRFRRIILISKTPNIFGKILIFAHILKFNIPLLLFLRTSAPIDQFSFF